MAKKVAKENSMEAVLANIEKQMGNKGKSVIKFGKSKEKCQVISFGYPEVDAASFCGGVPRGKVIEIFGPESGGKSFLSLKLMASAQKMGLRAALLDAEQSLDQDWAASHGVDIDTLAWIDDPMSAEDYLNYVLTFCKSGDFGIVVIDSTAALVPRVELEGKIGDAHVADLARVMSQACRNIIQACAATNTTCVFLNQIRDIIKTQGGPKAFGDTTTTPGGKALRFYSHQRIQVTPSSVVKVNENGIEVVVAKQSWVKFVKNKVARPFGNCQIQIVFDKNSMNPVVMLCNAAKSLKIIKSYKGELRIDKAFTEDGEFIETHTNNMVDLADYLVKNNLANMLIEKTIEKFEEDKDDMDEKELKVFDPIIYKMQEDKSLIVSPLANAKAVAVVVKEDGNDESKEIDSKDFES